MKSNAAVLLFSGIAAAIFVFFMTQTSKKRPEKLKVGICGLWSNLHPGLQHTLAGDLVLSNQFNPLVGFTEAGILAPLASKSWTISDDFKTFSFKIDPTKKFSDGSPLTAQDFKNSWEEAFKLEPISANHSLGDVLYALEGFEKFEKTGKISGIEAASPDTLILKFKKPFRMALQHLAGVRFSVFKPLDGKFIGTGKYVISELAKDKLLLTPNSYAVDAKTLIPVELSYVAGEKVRTEFEKGELDVWSYGFLDEVDPSYKELSYLEVATGMEALHKVVEVNGTEKSIFIDPELRLALQYVINSYLRKNPKLLNDVSTQFDEQVYLPLQPGRIEKEEVTQLIAAGERYLPKLLKALEKKPLVAYATAQGEWFLKSLKAMGLNVSPKSQTIPRKDLIERHYKKDDYDLLYIGLSVVTGDPDSIYHALGKQGAILNPVTYRPKVGTLLEKGRSLLSIESLDPHYKKVSRSIFTEVPFIHLGFTKAIAIYRKDRIILEGLSFRRNEGHLEVFKPKP